MLGEVNYISCTNVNDLPGEIWMEIPGLNENYFVSNYGRVKSLKKNKPYILNKTVLKGRYIVRLYKKKGCGFFKNVGHLVAATFIREPKENEVLIYLDGNTLKDFPENLMWISKKESVRSARNKHRYSHKGQNNGMAKLTIQNVKSIRQGLSSGKSVKELSESFNVIPRTIQRIKDQKTWANIN